MAVVVPLRGRRKDRPVQFGNPLALWALLLVPLGAALAWNAAVRRRRRAERMGTPGVVDRLRPGSAPDWRLRRTVVSLLALGLLALAAARPQYGKIEQSIRRAGVDVLLAIDVSPSMLAEDLDPNRLDRARQALRRLLVRLRGNRIGIIAFAGEAHLLCPMTNDAAIADLVLQSIDAQTVPLAGTDLGRAIDIARGAFERGGVGSHVLVLLTDGEDNEGRGLEAARRAAGVMRIYGVGIGTERGAPVPEPRGGYKESPGGGKVVSRLDMETLGAIAKATGGIAYAVGDTPASAVSVVADEIESLDKVMQESRKFVIHQDRYGWFLAPAMALAAWALLSRPPGREETRADSDTGPRGTGRQDR